MNNTMSMPSKLYTIFNKPADATTAMKCHAAIMSTTDEIISRVAATRAAVAHSTLTAEQDDRGMALKVEFICDINKKKTTIIAVNGDVDETEPEDVEQVFEKELEETQKIPVTDLLDSIISEFNIKHPDFVKKYKNINTIIEGVLDYEYGTITSSNVTGTLYVYMPIGEEFDESEFDEDFTDDDDFDSFSDEDDDDAESEENFDYTHD